MKRKQQGRNTHMVWAAATLLAAGTLGCAEGVSPLGGQGKDKAKENSKSAVGSTKDNTASKDAPVPEDSQGGSGSVAVQFSSSLAQDGLGLADLDLGNGIVISYAKLNIAAIKMKPAKERSEEDEKIDADDKADEKVALEDLEKDLLDSIANMGSGSDQEKPVIQDDGDSEKMALRDGVPGSTKMEPSRPEKGEESAGVDTKKGTERPDAEAMKAAAKDRRETHAERSERHEKMAKAKEKLGKREHEDHEKMGKRDAAMRFAGPYVYDALTGKLDQELPEIGIPDGSYRRIEFKLRRNFSVGESEALFGNVFVIQGTFTKDGVKVPFEVDYHIATNFRLAGDDGVKVDPDQKNVLGIVFSLKDWFAGVDLSKAEAEDDGKVVISTHSNHDLMQIIHHNLKGSSHFGKDKDGDGKISGKEKAGDGATDTDDEQSADQG